MISKAYNETQTLEQRIFICSILWYFSHLMFMVLFQEAHLDTKTMWFSKV